MQFNKFVSPYNPKNKYVSENDVKAILKRKGFNIQVNTLQLYQEAFTHKSFTKAEHVDVFSDKLKKERNALVNNKIPVMDLQENSYERLELLGDVIIKTIVTEYLFKRYYTESEGFITKLKMKVEDTISLARYARRLGLESHMVISKQNEDIGARSFHKLQEDIFEAFIGALYRDQGFEFCSKFIKLILQTEVAYSSILNKDNNYKERLQEIYHSLGWKSPTYTKIKDEKIDGKRLFTCGVLTFDGKIASVSVSTSIQKAQQEACRKELYKMNVLNTDEIQDMIDEKIINEDGTLKTCEYTHA
jgi:ribonuclease III